jgi:hypothetical protein
VDDAVRLIARSLDYPCAERLKPNLVWMAQHLAHHQALRVSPDTLAKLGQLSASTLKRILKRVGRSDAKIAFRQPARRIRPHLRQAYPMRKIPWDMPEPGHFEVDLVSHSGEDGSGEYIHTIQMVDVATGWSELAAVFGRSYKVMEDGFQTILSRLPFPVLELHPDNGAEFFNHHLLRFWQNTLVHCELTRSRPYHKNDNRFVEENNHSLVRAYVGHGRFDTLRHLHLLRQLYEALWQYHNLFQPVMRLKAKVFSAPLHYRRVFDEAKSPFDRLCECHVLPEVLQQRLTSLRQQTNPILLRHQIDQLITNLLAVSNDKSTPVNVHLTLGEKKISPSVTLSFDPSTTFR